MIPVAEPDSVVGGTTSEVDNERHKQEAHDGKDFDTGKPELGFTIDLNSEDVEGDNDNNENADPDSGLQ